jgi:hypothetical protein
MLMTQKTATNTDSCDAACALGIHRRVNDEPARASNVVSWEFI